MVLRKAMTLDKADKRKTEAELQAEIEQLKLIRNKDQCDIKQLKVELHKLDIIYKKYKEIGGLNHISANNLIQLPERFLHKRMNDPNEDHSIINTQTMIDDINFVKNQLQCEIIKLKNLNTLQHENKLPMSF
jgi:hypothetical protein